MHLVFDYRLYVTARTVDGRNSADQVYTSRARANWQFNGSGMVNQTAPYVWQGDENAGVRVLQGWTPVTDGSQPPQLSGELANDAMERETFN